MTPHHESVAERARHAAGDRAREAAESIRQAISPDPVDEVGTEWLEAEFAQTGSVSLPAEAGEDAEKSPMFASLTERLRARRHGGQGSAAESAEESAAVPESDAATKVVPVVPPVETAAGESAAGAAEFAPAPGVEAVPAGESAIAEVASEEAAPGAPGANERPADPRVALILPPEIREKLLTPAPSGLPAGEPELDPDSEEALARAAAGLAPLPPELSLGRDSVVTGTEDETSVLDVLSPEGAAPAAVSITDAGPEAPPLPEDPAVSEAAATPVAPEPIVEPVGTFAGAIPVITNEIAASAHRTESALAETDSGSAIEDTAMAAESDSSAHQAAGPATPVPSSVDSVSSDSTPPAPLSFDDVVAGQAVTPPLGDSPAPAFPGLGGASVARLLAADPEAVTEASPVAPDTTEPDALTETDATEPEALTETDATEPEALTELSAPESAPAIVPEPDAATAATAATVPESDATTAATAPGTPNERDAATESSQPSTPKARDEATAPHTTEPEPETTAEHAATIDLSAIALGATDLDATDLGPIALGTTDLDAPSEPDTTPEPGLAPEPGLIDFAATSGTATTPEPEAHGTTESAPEVSAAAASSAEPEPEPEPARAEATTPRPLVDAPSPESAIAAESVPPRATPRISDAFARSITRPDFGFEDSTESATTTDPDPETATASAFARDTEPEITPDSAPAPALNSESAPETATTAAPAPISEPESEPEPALTAEPDSIPEPDPAPAPDLDPAPASEPETEDATDPALASEPETDTATENAPAPALDPDIYIEALRSAAIDLPVLPAMAAAESLNDTGTIAVAQDMAAADSAAASAGAPPRPPARGFAAWSWGKKATLAIIVGVVVALVIIGTQVPRILGLGAVSAPAATVTETPPPVAEKTVAWTTLTGGECLTDYTSAWAEKFTVVDCGAAHTAQLVLVSEIAADPAAPFPGEAELAARSALVCSSPAAYSRPASADLPTLQIQASYPVTEKEWKAGQRSFSCFASLSGDATFSTSIAVPAAP